MKPVSIRPYTDLFKSFTSPGGKDDAQKAEGDGQQIDYAQLADAMMEEQRKKELEEARLQSMTPPRYIPLGTGKDIPLIGGQYLPLVSR